MTLVRPLMIGALLCFASCLSVAQLRLPAPLTTVERRLDLFGQPSGIPETARMPGDLILPGTRRSVGLAVLYSLLLPGMGELYAGGFSSGRYFLGAEGALWMTYAAFQIQGNALRDDARAFAEAHAGIAAGAKDDQFYVDVGNFMTTGAYNEKKLRDRQAQKLYDPAAGYGWSWDSDAARATFRDQRVASETMYNNRKFVAAAILVNHVASAINAARAAIAHNRAADDLLGSLQLSASLMGGAAAPHGILLHLSAAF